MHINTISVSPLRRPDYLPLDPATMVADIIINGEVSPEWSIFTLGMYWSVERNRHHVGMTEINNLPGILAIIERETEKAQALNAWWDNARNTYNACVKAATNAMNAAHNGAPLTGDALTLAMSYIPPGETGSRDAQYDIACRLKTYDGPHAKEIAALVSAVMDNDRAVYSK